MPGTAAAPGISEFPLLQFPVIWAYILIVTVFHQKTAGDHTQLLKSQFFIQMAGSSIGPDYSIELQNPESAAFPLYQAVLYQQFPYMLSSG